MVMEEKVSKSVQRNGQRNNLVTLALSNTMKHTIIVSINNS